MADQYTPLEDKLDALYAAGRDQLAIPGVVQSWEDFLQRRGYLTGLADCGAMIKELRKPADNPSGEISDILQPEEKQQ